MRDADVPAQDAGWLGPREAARASQLRVEKRRRDWRRGRLAAKRVLADRLGLDRSAWCRLEVLPADDGAPEPWLDDTRLDLSLSVSHSGDLALAACTESGTPVGCDVEQIEPRSRGLIETFFTPAEIERLEVGDEGRRARLANLTWSAKESALKVLRCGLRRDTRSVEVELDAAAPAPPGGPEPQWRPLRVQLRPEERGLAGWWAVHRGAVLTMVVDAAGDADQAVGDAQVGASS